MPERPSWDAYFMGIAYAVAARGTCDRKRVGAVLVAPRSRAILSTGYNGAPRGLPHCDEVGHQLVLMGERRSCVRTVHAEANAVAQAAWTGTPLSGATAYVTVLPCPDCAKLLINAGVREVVVDESYDSRSSLGDSKAILESVEAPGLRPLINLRFLGRPEPPK